MIGIYKITNIVNNKIYVGQSVHIQHRFSAHKSTAFNSLDPSYDYPLYRSIRKYGLENFLFEIIEECLIEELNIREKFWIDYYNSMIPNGYNIAYGSSTIQKITPDLVYSIILELKSSKEDSETIGEKFGVSGRTIRSINNGQSWHQENETYPIRVLRPKVFYLCEDCGIEISKGAVKCKECQSKTARLVERPSKEELIALLKEFNFTKVGKQFGVSDNAIRRWCRDYQISDKAKDYKNKT